MADAGMIIPRTASEIKDACRQGLHPVLRRSLWQQLVSAESRADFYAAACKRVFGTANPKPDRLFRVPFLGNEPWAAPADVVPLLAQPTVKVSSAHDRIVCILAQMHGLTHCPMAANLSLLLMTNCSEAETFSILECLVSPSALEKMLHQSMEEEEDFASAFLEVTRERHPQLVAHLEHCGRDQVLAMVRAWFSSFFYGWLPFEDVIRVVDAYLSEGDKVLVRLGMAWLRARKRALKACRNADEVERCLRAWVLGPDACAKVGSTTEAAFAYSFDAMARHGFELKRLSREVIMLQVRRAKARRERGVGSVGANSASASGRTIASMPASTVSSRGGEVFGGEDEEDDDDDDDGLVMLSPKKTVSSASQPHAMASARAASGSGIVRSASAGVPDASPSPISGVSISAPLSGGSISGRGVSGLRWYCPKLVGRPSSLLPLQPHPRDLATPAEVALAEAEARASTSDDDAATGEASTVVASEGSSASASASMTPLTAEQRQAVARRLALPASVVARPPSFSSSASPRLAALMALLPARANGRDIRCLYSTSVHSWTREALTRHTRGIAPLMLVVRVALPPSKASLSRGPAASSAPTIGLFASDGLPTPPGSGAAKWVGTPSDFIFQLSPHVVCFPAQPPSVLYASSASDADAAAAVSTAAAAVSTAAAAAAAAAAVSTRLRLSSERFVLSTDAFLACGGSSASTAAALRLPETFSRCSGSAELLFELGLLSASDVMAGTFGAEPELRLIGLEAFGFVDGSGSVGVSRGADGRAATTTMRVVNEAEASERERAAELAEQQARTYGGEASVAELQARVKRIVGDEEGARTADALLRDFEARRAEAAERLAALRK